MDCAIQLTSDGYIESSPEVLAHSPKRMQHSLIGGTGGGGYLLENDPA